MREYNKIYVLVCEYTWGCIPHDIKWAIGTSIYQQMQDKLINKGIILKAFTL